MRNPLNSLRLLSLAVAVLLAPKPAGAGECEHPRFTSCPENMVLNACWDGKEVGATLTYPEPTAVDDCGPVNVHLESGPPSGVRLDPGVYTVKWVTVAPPGEDQATCIFQVRVLWRPEIVCPRDTTVHACGPGGAFVDYTATAFDDCGPIPWMPDFLSPYPGSRFPIGTTRVDLRTVEDGNGSYRDCTFYVTVDWPRTLDFCPEDTTIYICPGMPGVHVDYQLPRASDLCGPIEMEPDDDTPPPGGFFPVGSTSMYFRSSMGPDGRFVSCSFHVRVEPRDDEPPTITCPNDTAVVAAVGETSAVVNYTASAVDNCPGAVTLECDPPSGSTFPCGVTTVTCTATDAGHNASRCTFTVSVGLPVSVDVKPGSCPNPFKTTEQGVVPVAIHGSRFLDVTSIDASSVKLEGVPALRWSLEDVGAPWQPYVGKSDCLDCANTRKDRIGDLTLKFDAVALRSALGPVVDVECHVVHITGLLADGCPIVGEDVLRLIPASTAVLPIDAPAEVLPATLSANHPNPFRAGSFIEYSLPRSGRVSLTMYDVQGRVVRNLAERDEPAGGHVLAWDGADESGARVANGLYFYILDLEPADGSEAVRQKRKLLLER